MISHYQELAADLVKISKYLESVSADHPSRVQRQFAYVASISTLYATFENFIERTAFRFAQIMLSSPDELDADELAKLKKRYVTNSSALLSQSLGTGRYQNMTELDVAQSLASCLDDSNSFDLRAEIVSLHNSNLRLDSLTALFSWAVKDLRGSIGKADAVRKWLGLAERPDGAAIDTVESELRLLVERRNEIAHRGIPDEILAPERVIDFVKYVEVVCLGLIACLGGRILEASKRRGDSVTLGLPSEFFQNDRVVVIASVNAAVAIGDVVWASDSNRTRWGTVRGIQLQGDSVARASEGSEVGISLDFVMPKNTDLHRWDSPTEDLIPAPSAIFGDRGS